MWEFGRIKRKFQSPRQPDQVRQARRLGSMEPQVLIQAVAQHDGVHADAYQQRRSTAAGGDSAAYLAHRHTTATLRDLAARIVETSTKTENRV
jgi:hypothetical protein